MNVSEALTDICVRVECLPHSGDDEHPVRLLVLSNTSGAMLARLKFTPAQAHRSSVRVARLLERFLPTDAARRIGEGLATAAKTVWSTRN